MGRSKPLSVGMMWAALPMACPRDGVVQEGCAYFGEDGAVGMECCSL